MVQDGATTLSVIPCIRHGHVTATVLATSLAEYGATPVRRRCDRTWRRKCLASEARKRGCSVVETEMSRLHVCACAGPGAADDQSYIYTCT